MKRFTNFLMLAAIAVASLASCARELDIPEKDNSAPEGYYVEELFASYPSAETRTAFDGTTGKFSWSEGDEIAFHLSDGSYTIAEIDPATSKVRLYIREGLTRDNFAVYPASAAVTEHAAPGDMQVTLPDAYNVSENPITDYVPMPMIATQDESNHLKFNHTGALLQVQLDIPAGTKTAKISLGDKALSGTLTVVADGDYYKTNATSVENVEDGNNVITFTVSENENGLAEDTQAYLRLPVSTGTYDEIKITYNDGEWDTYEFHKDQELTFRRSGGKKLSIANSQFTDATDYFWFQALEPGSSVSLTVSSGTFAGSYSFDKQSWTEWDYSEITLNNVGDKVYFKGIQTTRFTGKFIGTGKLAVGGRIYTLYSSESTTMWFKELFKDMTSLIYAHDLIFPENYWLPTIKRTSSNPNASLQSLFSGLFSGCSNLLTTPRLPAMILTPLCYNSMFANCISLTSDNLPELPALDLSVNTSINSSSAAVYGGMFSGCTALVSIPSNYLPATTLCQYCYGQMFKGCTGLVDQLPDLLAEYLSNSCYASMFEDCTSIKHTMELNSIHLNSSCYNAMFRRCTSLVDHCDLPATVIPDKAYYAMFERCTALETAGVIYAEEILPEGCRYMYYFDSALKNIQPILWVKPVSIIDVGYYKYSSYRTVNGEKIYDTGSYQCSDMYRGCGLTSVPQLPNASILECHRCFEAMFMDCASMTGTITLPAKVLNYGVYVNMFYGCKKLQKAVIMAEDADWPGCMNRMFYGCSNLKEIEVHFDHWPYCEGTDERPLREPGSSVTWDNYPLNNYVTSVSLTGKYYKYSSVNTEYGTSKIPSGWSVYEIIDVDTDI